MFVNAQAALLLFPEVPTLPRMKPQLAPLMRRLSRPCATLALITAMVLCGGVAQGATHRKVRRVAREGKAMVEAKSVRTVVPERREWRRLTTFNERFYPGIGRTFTTWW
jgi:hypothetical protein